MKKQFKIIILVAICMVVVSLYLGKNIFFKIETPKQQQNLKSSPGNSISQASNLPTLIEFSSET